MITHDQIPDEVVEALGAALGNTRPTWDYSAAIAAALNAWEGMDELEGICSRVFALYLPLPQEG